MGAASVAPVSRCSVGTTPPRLLQQLYEALFAHACGLSGSSSQTTAAGRATSSACCDLHRSCRLWTGSCCLGEGQHVPASFAASCQLPPPDTLRVDICSGAPAPQCRPQPVPWGMRRTLPASATRGVTWRRPLRLGSTMSAAAAHTPRSSRSASPVASQRNWRNPTVYLTSATAAGARGRCHPVRRATGSCGVLELRPPTALCQLQAECVFYMHTSTPPLVLMSSCSLINLLLMCQSIPMRARAPIDLSQIVPQARGGCSRRAAAGGTRGRVQSAAMAMASGRQTAAHHPLWSRPRAPGRWLGR